MEAVIVTHDSSGDLEGLLACQHLRQAFQRVLVVDDGSRDGSPELAEAAGVDVLRSGVNRGFAATANRGIEHSRGEILALMNPDIRLHSAEDVNRLVEHFADERVAMVAPGLELPDGSRQDSARSVPSLLDLVLRRWAQRDRGALRETVASDVPWVVGAFLLLRREAFEQVGGFDERYFLYFEDVDLCVRLKCDLWSIRFDPTIVMSHVHNAASRRSLISPGTRRHIASAARFYRSYPRYVFRGPGPRNVAAPPHKLERA